MWLVSYTAVSGAYPAADSMTQSTFASTGGGAYTRTKPDGTVQTFGLADGTGRLFLTQLTDPQGNSVVINYDVNFRITTITDAVNQVTTLAYVSNTFGNSGFYNVASITDPFGRSTSFAYDSTNTNLLSITDCIGLTSSFLYDTSATFITSMSTAYGVTAFNNYVPGNNGYPAQGLRITLPDGSSTVTENWANNTKSTYYWDREATALYPNDPAQQKYTHCIATQFVADSSLEGEAPQNEKRPLESTVYYTYPGQSSADFQGTMDHPSSISQALSAQSNVVTLSGTAVASDVVGLFVGDSGNHYFYYTVQVGDSLADIATHLASTLNANATMQQLGDFAVADANTVTMSANDNSASFSGISGTDAICTTKSAVGQFSTFTVGGTLTTGDVLYAFFYGAVGGNQSPSYTVQPGDTLSTAAAGLASAINANSDLVATGFSATSSGPIVTATTNYLSPIGLGTYVSGSQTETLTLTWANGANRNSYFQYNSLGHVTQAIDPLNRTFSYKYAGNNIDLLQITETQAGDNSQLGAWTYNSHHRPLTYTDGSGQVTNYGYNSSGQLTSITDANSNVTKLTYTGTGSATIGGTKTTGNILTITVHDAGLTGGQEAVNYTVLSTDTLSSIAAGLAAAINADVNLQAIGVSATSNSAVITMLSTSTNVTSYTESTSGGATETITLGTTVFGFLTKIDGPLSGSNDITTFAYDSVGRLASRTDSEGYTVNFAYDNMDRLTQTTYPDGSTEQITYNRLDAVLKKDRIGRTTQDSYDSLDLLSFEVDPLGRKTKYTWCLCGSLAALTDPAGNTTTWSHDLEGGRYQRPTLMARLLAISTTIHQSIALADRCSRADHSL